MKGRGKDLTFSEPEVELLLDVSYPDYRTFLLLSLLYSFIDLKNHFHVDHVFPKARLTEAQLRRAGIPEMEVNDFAAKANRLPNLQLLGGPENNEKRAKLPLEWLNMAFHTDAARGEHIQRHDLGVLPTAVAGFSPFFDERRAAMKARLQALLVSSAAGASLAQAEVAA